MLLAVRGWLDQLLCFSLLLLLLLGSCNHQFAFALFSDGNSLRVCVCVFVWNITDRLDWAANCYCQSIYFLVAVNDKGVESTLGYDTHFYLK
jgi:hypothetical protein